MLRTGRVENVAIFTGNREKELKEQILLEIQGNVNQRSFFDTKYSDYLINHTDIFRNLDFANTFHLLGDIIQNIKSKITVIWGTELIKKTQLIPKENTLFIFEESHFAQSLGQTPGKFLNAIGIPGNGDTEMLEQRNNYICSVSATPFSELCDAGNFNQSKKVVKMRPGNGYRGVKWFTDNNKIIGYDDWETSLRTALRNKKDEGNWAILRVRGNEQFEVAERICIREEWVIRNYDQENSDISSMKDLQNKPNTASIVILRERCRMGTVVPKEHLAFVFETSTVSKTDTMLQGLLGRACGYHNNDTLLIYLNRQLIESGEIDTYIEFCEGGENAIPTNAKNVIGTVNTREPVVVNRNNMQLYPIIPIHIPRHCISEESKFEDIPSVIIDIIYTLSESNEFGITNDNTESVNRKIIEELNKALPFPKKVNNNRISKKSHKSTLENILNGIKYKKPTNGGSKILNTRKDVSVYKVSLYYVEKPVPNFDLEVGSYYLCCMLNLTDEEIIDLKTKRIRQLPQTNGKEIFRYCNFLETGEVDISNGGFSLTLKPETATNLNIMFESIRECVLRSKETETMLVNPKRICSIRQPGFEKYTGIFISLEVYCALLYGGNIYNRIKEEFNVEIKLTKSKGRQPNMPPGCIYRLAEISWK